ncbi:MAG: hypothetical protein GY832_00130 [Chloroflexi bacterium]|nr:hypothetical protein [Chloroflexota bacterium]
METSRKRVLVIGIDAATFDLIDPWIAAGHLPNLSNLMSQSCRGPLTSTMQPVSAPAWTTFMTGVNQGQHGLYDFVRRRPDSYKLEVTNTSAIAKPTIFDLVGDQGRRVVALNVPYTFPPRPVNGVVVGGPFAPVADASIVYPPELGDTLMSLADGYFITADYDSTVPDPMSSYVSALKRGVEYRRQLAVHLMDTEPWDLFVAVFMASDQIQHFFWHCMEADEDDDAARFRHAIRDVYQHIDVAIGALLERIDEDTTVIVISDHGAGPLRAIVNLNRWLAEADFLHFRASRNKTRGQWRSRLVEKAAGIYSRYAPAALRARVRSQLGVQRFEQLKGDMETVLFTSAIEWGETKAYALGAAGNIYLNVAGREPEGIVQPGVEYEALRDKLIDKLMALQDPETGERIVHRVWRREEQYHGPCLEQAPDLIIEWVDYGYWGRGRYDIQQAPIFETQKEMDFNKLRLSGTHRPDGIFIASGPGVEPRTTVEGARILDLAPTILGILDLPIPKYMDGTVLHSAFVEGTIASASSSDVTATAQPLQDTVTYTEEDAAKVAQRLEDLGYL